MIHGYGGLPVLHLRLPPLALGEAPAGSELNMGLHRGGKGAVPAERWLPAAAMEHQPRDTHQQAVTIPS